MDKSTADFENALLGRHIPILPLDNKWHKLMVGLEKTEEMLAAEEKIKELLKRQGKINTDIKILKKKKQQLLDGIVGSMDEQGAGKSQENDREAIEKINQTLEDYQQELHELPNELGEYNYILMLGTMNQCYEIIADNTAKIEEIAAWIADIRVELKKNVVRKQEKELKNQEIYNYMHDIFGAEVIDIFDMKYDPGEKILKKGNETH